MVTLTAIGMILGGIFITDSTTAPPDQGTTVGMLHDLGGGLGSEARKAGLQVMRTTFGRALLVVDSCILGRDMVCLLKASHGGS